MRIGLLEDYINNLNIHKAEKCTDVLITTKNIVLITETTAITIESKTNVTPKKQLV